MTSPPLSVRGFAAIGLTRPKTASNVGGVLRAAHAFGASLVAIEGDRSSYTCPQDTTKAYRHLPVVRGEDLFALCPVGAVPIAVDLVPGAIELQRFRHPEQAFYIFGPEDGTLGARHLDRCVLRVKVPTVHCLNLAACVNVILYDRVAKTRIDERPRAA